MADKLTFKDRRKNIRAAYKSDDTEEWFDKVFTKPLGYIWAVFFIKLNWTPNMVTILGMIMGFIGGLMFVHDAFYLRLIGVILVIWANIFDSTDGQIARLTNQRSKIGRLLDGLCTFVWYGGIYPAIAIRLMPRLIPFTNIKWGPIIFIVILFNLLGHAKQCRMADYFRQVHLFYLKNKDNDEWDRSSDLKITSDMSLFEKLYTFLYRMYTRSQEKCTPYLQAFVDALEETGDGAPSGLREEYLERSRKYIQLTNILTFNTRAYTLFICVLIDMPLLYFAIDIVIFNLLNSFMISRYEKIARELHVKYKLPGYENVKHRFNYKPIFFAIGLIGVAVMVWQMDVVHMDWQHILKMLPIILPAGIAAYFLVYIAHTFAQWAVIGRNTNGLTFLKLLRITLSTFALNNVTPVSFAGGEPYKIMELKPYLGTASATADAFSFSIMNFVSLLSLWVTGAVSYFILNGFTVNILRTVLMSIAFVLCIAVVIFVLIPKRTGMLMKLMHLCEKLPFIGRRIAAFNAKHAETISATDIELAEFKKHPCRLWTAFLCEHMSRMFEALELTVLYNLMGAPIKFAQALVIMTITSMFGNFAFFIPMQLGAREGGMALGTSWCNIDEGVGITAALFARLREVFFAAVGVCLILIGNKKAEKRKEHES